MVLAPWVVVFLIRFRAGGSVVAPVQFWFEFASTYSYVAALRTQKDFSRICAEKKRIANRYR